MKNIHNIMKYKALPASAFALLFVLFSGQVKAQDFSKIDMMITNEKYDQAEAELQKLYADDSRNEKIDYRLGRIDFVQERFGQARVHFTDGVKHASRKPINYVGLGAVAVKDKNFDLAKEKLTKALEVDKQKSPATMLDMADAYLGWEGKVMEGAAYYKEAEALLLQVTSKDPENPAGYVKLGELYDAKGINELAKTYYEKAINFDDSYINGHQRLGILYKKEEKYNEAAAEFKKCLALNDQYAPALIEMSEMYYGIKQYDKGLDYMNQYLAIMGENDLNALKRKGIFLYLGEKYTDAVEVFASIQDKVTDPVVPRLLAYSYVKMDPPNADKALAAFDTYFGKVADKNIIPMDYQNKGAALGQKGDVDGMVAEYEKAIALADKQENPQPELLLSLSTQFKEQKDYANQAKFLSRYLETQERFNLKETFNLGRAYYFGEDYPNADSTFSKMVNYKSELYLGYLWLGRVHDKQDEKSAQGLALADYNKVYELLSVDEATMTKYKRDFLEACRYLGAYHTLVSKEYKTAIPYWQHILTFNPEDGGALEGLKFCESQG